MRVLAVVILVSLAVAGCAGPQALPAYESAYRSIHEGTSRADAVSIMSPYADRIETEINSSWGMPPEVLLVYLPDNKVGRIETNLDTVIRVRTIEQGRPRVAANEGELFP